MERDVWLREPCCFCVLRLAGEGPDPLWCLGQLYQVFDGRKDFATSNHGRSFRRFLFALAELATSLEIWIFAICPV